MLDKPLIFHYHDWEWSYELKLAREYVDQYKSVAFQLRRLNELIDAYGMKMALDWFLAEG